MPKPIADERYVLLTTFRKNGDAKPTPVWVAPLGEELAVITLADAWKVRRVRNTPEVRLQPCDVRGKVSPDAPIYKGRGRVVTDPAEVGQVKTAMNRVAPSMSGTTSQASSSRASQSGSTRLK